MQWREVGALVSYTTVSLVANEILLRASFAECVIDDWFHWYTRVWSALQFHVDPSGMSSKNPLIEAVNGVVDRHPDIACRCRATQLGRLLWRRAIWALPWSRSDTQKKLGTRTCSACTDHPD